MYNLFTTHACLGVHTVYHCKDENKSMGGQTALTLGITHTFVTACIYVGYPKGGVV